MTAHDTDNDVSTDAGNASDVDTDASDEIEYKSIKLPHAPKASSPTVEKVMRANKGKDTKPELVVRKRLRQAGLIGYRLHWKVPGHPDIAWPGKKIAIFVNGCFWHRCPHCHPSMPKTNVEYWTAKFELNKARDKKKTHDLEQAGWRVHVIWECQLKKKNIDATFDELLPILSSELDKPLRTTGT